MRGDQAVGEVKLAIIIQLDTFRGRAPRELDRPEHAVTGLALAPAQRALAVQAEQHATVWHADHLPVDRLALEEAPSLVSIAVHGAQSGQHGAAQGLDHLLDIGRQALGRLLDPGLAVLVDKPISIQEPLEHGYTHGCGVVAVAVRDEFRV